MKYLRKFGKMTLWIGAMLLGLFLFAWVLLQRPAVQQWVVNKVTEQLSNRFQTRVSVDKVHIRFFKTAVLEGVYLEDQKGDTLLYTGRIAAEISLFSITKRRLHFREISLENAVCQIKQRAGDSTYNFSFLLENTTQEQLPKAKAPAWDIDLKHLTLKKVRFSLEDEQNKNKGDLLLGELVAKPNKLDLAKQLLDIRTLELNRSQGQWRIFPNKSEEENKVASDSSSPKNLVFPNLAWDIKVANFKTSQNTFAFHNHMYKDSLHTLDLNHLQAHQLSFELSGFQWHKKALKAELNHFSFEEKNGLKINELTFKAAADSSKIDIADFTLKTPFSQLGLAGQLDLPQQQDETVTWNQMGITGVLHPSRVRLKDLDFLFPLLEEWLNVKALEKEHLSLEGAVSGSLGDLKGKALRINLGNRLSLTVDFEMKVKEDGRSPYYTIHTSLNSSYEHLKPLFKKDFLPAGLADLGKLRLRLSGKGRLDNFKIDAFDGQASSGTTLRGIAQVRNLADRENAFFDIGIHSFSTTVKEWRGFVPTLPPNLDSLGKLNLSANAQGFVRNFVANVEAGSRLGGLSFDLKMQTAENGKATDYTGELKLSEFHLEKIINVEGWEGPLNIQLEGKGRGLEWPGMEAQLKGEVAGVKFKKYAYPLIRLDGQISGEQLISHLSSKNEHLDIDLKSEVNFKDSIPVFDLTLALDHLAAKSLHLSDSTLDMRFLANAHFQGRDLDELEGQLAVQNLRLAGDSLSYETPEFKINALIARDGKRKAGFRSDFLTAEVEGYFQPSRLGELALGLLDPHFRLEKLVDSTWVARLDSLSLQPALRNQLLKAKFRLNDPTPLRLLALPALHHLQNFRLDLSLDHPLQALTINAEVDTLAYADLNLVGANIKITGDRKEIKADAVGYAGEDYPGLSQASLKALIGRDSLFWAIDFLDTAALPQLQLGGTLAQTTEQFLLHLAPDVIFSGQKWTIRPDHQVYLKPGWFFIHNLLLLREQQHIALQSLGDPTEEGIATVKLDFSAFDISEITKTLQYPDSVINGKLNGNIQLHDLGRKPYFTANLNLEDLLLNDLEVGQLNLSAFQRLADATIDLDLKLEGKENHLKLGGYYQTDLQQLSLKSEIERLNLGLLNPITEGVLQDNKGTLSGELTVEGKLENPAVKGLFKVQDFVTHVPFVNSQFQIASSNIRFDQKNIHIDSTDIKDGLGNIVTLSGDIRHRNFDAFRLALKANTNQFQFLNTSVADNELFFGQLLLKAGIDIAGPISAPRLEIDATTLSPSSFSLSPFSVTESIIDADDYVIFSKPEEEENALEKKAFYEVKKTVPFDVRLNLDLTDAAEFQFIIDPATGDKLVCRGDADLILRMTPSGEIQLSGAYTVTSGTYSFSYGQLLRRKFDIKKGGRVYFTGNPLDAQFDLEAAYGLKTTTFALIDSDSQLDPIEEEKAKERQPLEVVLHLAGDLNKPAINFSIELPAQNGNAAINSLVQRKLSALNNSPNELNQQVFSLLLFKNFTKAEQHLLTDVAVSSENAAFSSVAQLFSSQLNRLAENYVKGVEINFDFDAYKQDYASTNDEVVTQLDMDLSKQFFNDRLKIQAGTNVDLRSGRGQSNVNTFSGDYVLEYKLTKKGNFLLRVFRKDEFDILLEENTAKTGFSIFLKKAFDGKKK